VATFHAFDAGRTITRPTNATQGSQKVLRPTVNLTTFDLRDIFLSTNHRDVKLSPLRIYTDNTGIIVTGAKLVGEQVDAKATWGMMEFGRETSPNQPDATYSLDFSSAPDFSDNGITVTPSVHSTPMS
jgi:hypothetical protein